MVQHWSIYMWVALGSGLGGVGRLWVSSWVHHRLGPDFPWGTLAVNVLGSLVIGVLAAFTVPEAKWILPPKVGQFFMLGVCGGFTTFSSFSLQTMDLMQKGAWLYAALNGLASLALCLGGVFLGYALGFWLNR